MIQNESGVPLVLGTVQLGLDYGVANKRGKPAFNEAFEIVDTTWMEGVRFFDTAQAYGDSEKILGSCFREMRKKGADIRPCVITKLRPDIDPTETGRVLREIDASLERLGIEELWGLMLHRESWLDNGSSTLSRAIFKIKGKGKFKHFGVSVYSPEKAIQAFKTEGIDIIQIPFNVFDQRSLEMDIFRLARNAGKRVFIRSIYLQGLLIMNPAQLPAGMVRMNKELEKYRKVTEEYGLSPKLTSLAFVVQKAPDAFFVIGAETSKQVRENVALWRLAKQTTLPDLSFLASNDPQLINPSLWN